MAANHPTFDVPRSLGVASSGLTATDPIAAEGSACEYPAMSVRSYIATFFTREYWRALGGFILGIGLASHTVRNQFWDRVDREAEGEQPVETPE